ncbi:MAG: phosphate acyltransferase PlsX [Oscillospiraceae bacterium]|nr:phosphate acyltransferase PlsX [Oscillospiraceae bacterium]
MKIVVDAFGGDNAPHEILKGAAAAKAEYDIEIALTGKADVLLAEAKRLDINIEGLELVEAPSIMEMSDEAKAAIRKKADSSMSVMLRMLAEGKADACVSAGPTGAYLMGATTIVKRIKGVKRPALGAVMPGRNNPFILVDCGANAEVRPEMLEQFGLMGSIYMKNIYSVAAPRVGLANNGAEEGKGTDLQRAAYDLLQKNSAVNFAGNIEGRDIPEGACDVVVADGFTGNLILKTVEGMAISVFSMLKETLTENFVSSVAAMMLKPGLKKLKKKMDYSEYGGAPLIGLTKPVVKAHGSSDANAIKNAIRQAMLWSAAGVTEEIAGAFGSGVR